MKSIRAFALLSCFGLMTLLLAGCEMSGGYTPRGSDTAANTGAAQAIPQSVPQATAGTPVKVGILLPLSGQNKALGEAMLNAAQMALFDIGSTNFELIPRDTKNSSADAVQAAQSAVQAGAQLILGPVFAHDVRAVKSVVRSAGINMITFSTDWTLADGQTFVMGFLPFDQVERIARYAAGAGIKNAAIASPASSYGRAVSRTFSNAAAANGMKISTTLNFPEQNPDLAGIAQSLARTTPPIQAVFMPVGGAQAVAFADQLSAQGLDPVRLKRIGTGLFDDGALMRTPNLDGAWFAAPSPNLRARFVERYKGVYAAQPPRLSTLAYDATALALVLARREGEQQSTKPAFDRGTITNPNGFSGIDGIFRFRSDGTIERGLAILEYRDGKITVIEEAPRTFEGLTSQ